MLQDIRDNTQGIIAKIIIGLIIVPFALFGIDSLVGGGGQQKVATINGEDVSAVDLNQAMMAERQRLMNMMGDELDPSLLEEKRLRGPALKRLIQKRLLLQSAAENKVGVAVSTVDQTIVSLPQFQQDGQFSPQLYQNILRSNGYTPGYFKQLMAEDMMTRQLTSGIAGSDFITTKELEAATKIAGEQRDFRYFILPKSKVADQVIVSEDEVKAYYDKNLDSFQTEELVKLDYIEIRQQDFFEPVPADQIREAFELEAASFSANEERRAAHLLIEVNEDRSEQQAKDLVAKLADKIAAGEAFAELAKNFSDDKGSSIKGGDLGYTAGDTFPPEFEKALFSLELNQVSSPVKTDSGYHLILATEINQGEKPSFEDRKAVLKQRIQLAAAEQDFVTAVENLRDQVFNSEGLTGPAKELGFNVQQSDLVSRTTVTGSLANPQVIGAAFSADVLEEGNNSEVIELSTDHFIVVNVVDHQLPRAKSLAEVNDEIIAMLNQKKVVDLSLAIANTAIEKLQNGASIEDLANTSGYQWQLETNVGRNSTLNRALLRAVFSMPSINGDVSRQAVALDDGGVAVVQLEKVEEGSWSALSLVEQQGLKAELERNTVSQSLAAFLKSLRDSAEVVTL